MADSLFELQLLPVLMRPDFAAAAAAVELPLISCFGGDSGAVVINFLFRLGGEAEEI
mgnify:CR=1 FL=1